MAENPEMNPDQAGEDPNSAATKTTALPEDQSSVFFVNLKDKAQLYNAFMPFIVGGGLFIHTDKDYKLGDEVFLLVKLMDETEKYPVAGVVAWLTPKCAQGGSAPGIGVRFMSEDSEEVLNKIENYLAGALTSDRRTDTM